MRPHAVSAASSDTELLESLRTAPMPVATATFELIYRRHYLSVIRFAARFVTSRDAAEDLAQTIFFRVWDRRSTLEIRGSFRTYLLSAVRFEALDMARHARVVERAMMENHLGVPLGMGAGGPSPEETAEEVLLNLRFRGALAQLPERQRSALVLRWEQGLEPREIAQVLGIGHAAVYRLLERAAESLKAAM